MNSKANPPTCDPVPAGRPWPIESEWVPAEDAFNFALYSRHATGVTPAKRGTFAGLVEESPYLKERS